MPSLGELFRATLPEGAARAWTDQHAHLERGLVDLWEDARASIPSVSVPAPEFVRYLAERVPLDATSVDSLKELRTADLYLACACARGDSAAIETFEASYLGSSMAAWLPRNTRGDSGGDDVRQVVREKLLVRQGEAAPKIADYAGRGDLSSWVRVVAVRAALNLARGEGREIALDEDALLADRAGAGDVEVDHLKKLYRAEFTDSFVEALATLTPRERNVLRQHYVDGLTMDKIGTAYNVHRITVVRWIEKARTRLAAATHKSMMARLRIERGELDSILRLIRSQLDVSLRFHLR